MNTAENVSKKNCKGLTRIEVANLLQPIIELHGIEVKDDRFEFSSDSSFVGMSESDMPEDNKTTVILYKDIVSIYPFKARIEVLLLLDELYTFSTTDTTRTRINTYGRSENTNHQKPTTAQDVAGNIWDGLEKKLASGKK